MRRNTLWPTAALARLTAGLAAASADEADFPLRKTERLHDLGSVKARYQKGRSA